MDQGKDLAAWKTKVIEELKRDIRAQVCQEIKNEMTSVKSSIADLSERFTKIEESQDFISKQFDDLSKKLDSLSSTIQTSKKQFVLNETNTKALETQLENLQSYTDQLECEIDEMQQYLRRDCLEIVGVPKLLDEEPKEIVKEICNAMNIDLKDEDISIAHRLPDNRKTKDRIIVKFVRRDVKDKIYSNKKKVQGKSANVLQSIHMLLAIRIHKGST